MRVVTSEARRRMHLHPQLLDLGARSIGPPHNPTSAMTSSTPRMPTTRTHLEFKHDQANQASWYLQRSVVVFKTR